MNYYIPTISFFEAISETDYYQNLKDDLFLYISENFSSQQNSLYLYIKKSDTKPPSKILLIQHKMKILFGKTTFDVPLLIYLLESFPLSSPEIFIQKINNNIAINPKLQLLINKNLHINYENYINWDKNIDGINKILKYLYNIFLKNFPIYINKHEVNKATGLCLLDYANIKYFIKNNNDLNLTVDNVNVKKNISTKSVDFHKKRSNSNEKINFNNDFTPLSNKNLNENLVNNNIFFTTPDFQSIESCSNENNIKILNDDLKKNLIEKLSENKLFNKIKEEKNKQENFNKILNNIKFKLNFEMNQMNEILNKKNSLMNEIFLIQNELKNINNNDINVNEIYIKINLMNFNPLQKGDNLIYINNINTTHRFIKEFTADEMLKIIKRAFEKKIIDFKESLNLTRKISREIMFFKFGQQIHNDQ